MNYLTDASKVVRHFERNWSGVSGPVRASQYRSADIILKSGPLACPLLAQADIGECSASGDVRFGSKANVCDASNDVG